MGGHLLVRPHGHARARLAVLRNERNQVLRTEARRDLQPFSGCFRTIEIQQQLTQPLADTNGGIRSGIGAAGDARVDLAQGNFVGHQDRRLKPGTTGLLDVVGRRFRRQPRSQNGFAGQVEITGMLDDGPGHHLAQAFAFQTVTVHKATDGRRQHVLVGEFAVRGVRPGKRNPVTAQNCNGSWQRLRGRPISLALTTLAGTRFCLCHCVRSLFVSRCGNNGCILCGLHTMPHWLR